MVTVILPNQLFDTYAATICLYEHPLYLSAYLYHKHKLVLHRASCKYYFVNHPAVTKKYFQYDEDPFSYLLQFSTITLYDPVDHNIVKQFAKFAKSHNIQLKLLSTPMFVCLPDEPFTFNKSFYVAQCKKLSLHPKLDGTSYDKLNRKRFKSEYVEELLPIIDDEYIREACEYVNRHFAKNPGTANNIYLPYTAAGAAAHFDKFITQRLSKFGPYEDAMRQDVVIGYHSCLSPLLNIGLILPMAVLKRVASADVCIQSKEGFVRQMFWREYVRLVYMKYHKELARSNLLRHNNKLPFWLSPVGVLPVDHMIGKFLKYGWLHHIERLMIIGTYALITHTRPDYVHDWFMMFVDAYPWVMLPNVYGMSQYSAGPIMMRRPYFCSSNYILKMSDFRGPFTETWDILYYYFIYTHQSLLKKMYAYASAVKVWSNKTLGERRHIISTARKIIAQYAITGGPHDERSGGHIHKK